MRAAPKDRSPAARTAGGYAITVLFELIEGCFAEFHRLVSENAETSVSCEPGCQRFDVLTPIEGAVTGQIFLYEIYHDRAAFDLHLASEHYRRFDLSTRAMVSRKTVRAFTVAENARPAGVP